MQISTISFTKFGHSGTLSATRITWHLKNNLDEHQLDIQAAFINWSERNPSSFSVKAFCEYVKSKDPKNLICKPHRS